jgi:hypothetical protein
MARLPEVCLRFGQLSCLGLAEAKLFELIDPPQEALAVRNRLKSLTALLSGRDLPRRTLLAIHGSHTRLAQETARYRLVGSNDARSGGRKDADVRTRPLASGKRGCSHHRQAVSVGQMLLIDDIKWLVEAQELPRDPRQQHATSRRRAARRCWSGSPLSRHQGWTPPRGIDERRGLALALISVA